MLDYLVSSIKFNAPTHRRSRVAPTAQCIRPYCVKENSELGHVGSSVALSVVNHALFAVSS